MVLIIRSIFLTLLLTLLLLTQPVLAGAEEKLSVSAEACVLLCEDGTALFEKHADNRCLIASTTKLMTALVCLENTDPDDTVIAQKRHCEVEGSSMYLRAGEAYTVRELLLGLLLASGNDAALALAEYTAGSEQAFVVLMNQKAAVLGLVNTHFENPHGLDAKGHYSSARDLATLMLYCMENTAFCELTATKAAEVKGLTLLNHNRLLNCCPGCIGGKTGYTNAAGRCLVSVCERGGLLLVCVTLSDPDDWNDHMRLYDWAYTHYALHDLREELMFDVPVISGSREAVHAVPAPGIRVVLPRDGSVEYRVELPRFVFAPVEAGDMAGLLTLLQGGKDLYSIPLLYSESAVQAERY